MKTSVQTIFLMWMTATLYGQDLTGQWNGTLQVQGNKLRILFHVTKPTNQWEATLGSPDQNARSIKVTTTNFSYPTVTFEMSSIGAVYEGTMSEKGIIGRWVQSGTSLFLVLSKSEESSKEKTSKMH